MTSLSTPQSIQPDRPRPQQGRRLPEGLAAFSYRNYRLFFVGQLISVTGTWMQGLAQSWLVLTLTSSALKLGLVNVFQFAPILLIGLISGVIADRYPRRQLLIVTQVLSGITAGVLAILTWQGAVTLWQVYAVALALGIVNAFDLPARQAFVGEMVDKEDLPNAVALNSALFNGARIIGPAIGGIVLGLFGAAACFGVNAISYLGSVAGLGMMRLKPRPRVSTGETQMERLRAGLRYVRVTPAVSSTIILVGIVATFGMNFTVWIPLLAKNDFNLDARGFGLLMSALGGGSFVGAIALAFLGRRPLRTPMLMTAAVLGLGEIALALAAIAGMHVWVAYVLLPVIGFGMTTTMAMANTVVQTTTPEDLRGRVMSVYLTIFAGATPFGALFTGAVAKGWGTPASMLVAGITAILGTAYVAWRVSHEPRVPAVAT